MVKSEWVKLCRRSVESFKDVRKGRKHLKSEGKETSATCFFDFMGMWFEFCSVSDWKSSVSEDLGKVACHWLGRMNAFATSDPWRVIQAGLVSISAWGKRASLYPETSPERPCLCQEVSGRSGGGERLSQIGFKRALSAQRLVGAMAQENVSACVCSSATLSLVWILLCVCSEKKLMFPGAS